MQETIRQWVTTVKNTELEKRIKQDKKHPGVLIELRKSTALWDIAYFIRDKVITMDELEGFSADLIDAVKLILSR